MKFLPPDLKTPDVSKVWLDDHGISIVLDVTAVIRNTSWARIETPLNPWNLQ
ncbi:hypothetical protein YDC107_5438 [Escherichia phage YDC107_2]|nr:hypothetical protein YDC107_5438 [Escherichia phage YDC107_2]